MWKVSYILNFNKHTILIGCVDARATMEYEICLKILKYVFLMAMVVHWYANR